MTTQVLEDGHGTLITFSLASTVEFEELEVTLPAIKGGGKKKMTTMHNVDVHTGAPKKLFDIEAGTVLVAWDPLCYQTIMNTLVNKNGQITVTLPNGATIVYWGFIDEFTPKPLKEGERPEADVKFEITNRNGSGVTTKPAYTAGTTTTT